MSKSVKRDVNLGIIVEAKQEYTKQLIDSLRPCVFDSILVLFKRSKDTSDDNQILVTFQKLLKEIPKWNTDVIKEHTYKINEECGYFNDLLTAVFLSNVKILSSVKLKDKKSKLRLTIPSNDTFIHKVYINVARNIYANPYVVSTNMRHVAETQRLGIDVYTIINNAIEQTIRELLPIKNILESYLIDTLDDKSESDSDDNEEEEEEEESHDPPPPFVDDDDDDIKIPVLTDDDLEKPDVSKLDDFFTPIPDTKDISVIGDKNIHHLQQNALRHEEEAPRPPPPLVVEEEDHKPTTFFEDL
jgi:hypothetical protein